MNQAAARISSLMRGKIGSFTNRRSGEHAGFGRSQCGPGDLARPAEAQEQASRL